MNKNFIYLSLIVLSLALIVASLVNMLSETPEKAASADKMMDDTLLVTKINLSPKYINFGRVSDDTLLQAKVTIYNVGDNVAKILHVNPDCSCTGYELSKKEIAVGDSALLTLKLRTNNKFGKEELRTVVKANTKEKMYLITILADVYEKNPR